ncbi:MAG: hypothetical protein U0235_34790 [Polyangiaceae bacterium]
MNLRSAVVLAFFGSVAACSVSLADATSGDASPAPETLDASGGGASEAATTSSVNKWGSALCGVQFGCDPDEAAQCSPLAADFKGDAGAGTPSLVDAGSPAPNGDASVPYDAGNANPADGIYACRVARRASANGTIGAQCVAAGAGRDGDACRASADCGPGFECVGSPGQCRRYCCATPCGNERVCDKQIVTGNEGLTVPVCMPIHPCKLLGKSCPTVMLMRGISRRSDRRAHELRRSRRHRPASRASKNCADDHPASAKLERAPLLQLCSKSHSDCPSENKVTGTTPLFFKTPTSASA